MFTGIIEEVGIIEGIQKNKISSKIRIKASKVLRDTQVGDSIATNGVCLTVAHMKGNSFEADIMSETLKKSNLGMLTVGSQVNLERALSLQDRLGGHIVTGHIDDTGEIISFIQEENAVWITVKTSANILNYILYKGSITIDGISLTIAFVDTEYFKVSIVPHTGSETTLLKKKVGDLVNLECDVIGKYVEHYVRNEMKQSNQNQRSIDKNFLRINGFL